MARRGARRQTPFFAERKVAACWRSPYLREPLGSTADKTMQRERSGQLSYGAIHIQTFRRGDNGLVGYQAALSSMMRSAARLAGFFVLSHVFDGLERSMASQEIEPKLGAE